MEDCIFCKIVRGQIPAQFVLEDDKHVAFRDINPKAREHVLVVPRQHVSSLNDLGATAGAEDLELLRFIVRVAEVLGIRESGYRALVNVGPDGGQEIPHLHFHVLGGEDLGDFR